MTAWEGALDRYEAALDRHELLLDGDEPSGPDPWPPPDLPTGDLPVALRPRAAALLHRSHELTRRLQAMRHDLPPLAPARRAVGRATPASRIDRVI